VLSSIDPDNIEKLTAFSVLFHAEEIIGTAPTAPRLEMETFMRPGAAMAPVSPCTNRRGEQTAEFIMGTLLENVNDNVFTAHGIGLLCWKLEMRFKVHMRSAEASPARMD